MSDFDNGDYSGFGPSDKERKYTLDEARAALTADAPEIEAAEKRGKAAGQSQAARDVLAERERQQTVEGWTPEHDDCHMPGELARAAVTYALNAYRTSNYDTRHCLFWPFNLDFWKPTNRRRDLVKAGALILAEIERLDRLSDLSKSEGT